ncbi:MAG: hypothetical protein MZV70_33880 [Desulfobacterales bacterium]|nr:hypothetical protein [Desulfobacterales bacterium]
MVCNADEGEPGTFKDRVLLGAPRRPGVRGHDRRRLRASARARASSTCAASTATCSTRCSATLERRRARRAARHGHLRRSGLRFRHRDPRRRGLVRLRRGVRAGRVAGGQARHPAQPAAAARREGLPRPPDHRQQRRDLLRRRADRCCTARDWFRACGTARVLGHQAALGVGRLRAARHLRVPVRRHACAQVLAGLRRQRHDRGAGRRAVRRVPRPGRVRPPHRLRGHRRPAAPSSCSTAAATCSRWRGNFAHFFAHESCGFCTPCRVGTSLLRNLMDKIRDGKGSQHDLDDASRSSATLLHGASHCGLGESAGRPLLDTLRALPSGLRAAPAGRMPSNPPSTSTARWHGARRMTGPRRPGRPPRGARHERRRCPASGSTARMCRSRPARPCCRRRSPPAGTSRTCATTRSSARTAAASSAR